MADVVLVHGLWYGPVSLALLRRRLQRAGFRCHDFRYPTLSQSLSTNAGALREYVETLPVAPGSPLHLVGHSLGGLVILRMLDEYRGLPDGRVVLLGTPVGGSEVARHVAGKRLIRPFLGQAREALDSGFRHAPPGREIGVVAGTLGLGLGRFLSGLRRRHDGTVNVAETDLPGASDRIELRVSHTGLVTSRQVADAVIRFLDRGRFAA